MGADRDFLCFFIFYFLPIKLPGPHPRTHKQEYFIGVENKS